jgi:N-acetylglucosamine malate deacetylase 1
MKIDILAIGVHPDDVELGCSGTILSHVQQGHKVGIADLTRGELGTRGNADLRIQEAEKAARILGVEFRENLGFADGFFTVDEAHINILIRIIRKYQPEIVLCNAPHDRHPDHGRASKLVLDACFYSGLIKIKTKNEQGGELVAWRPKAIYHYIQDRYIKPDFAVDISSYMDKKLEAILAFSSQFYNPASNEPETPISSPAFLNHVKGRAMEFGRQIGVEFAEGYTTERCIGTKSFFDLI